MQLLEFTANADQSSLSRRLTHTSPRTQEQHLVEVEYTKRQAAHASESSQVHPSIDARVDDTTINLCRPVRLLPTSIAKPWGQEIWYTGMEERGESQVCDGNGNTMPLSLYLALTPSTDSQPENVLLLKVLDPNPEPVAGDLYFETHEEKQEVYIVTHIDPVAWPDGKGAIRYGMNQAKRAGMDDRTFRNQYAAAVSAYASVRHQIDRESKDVDAATEQFARTTMESFTHLRELSVADVVKVPTWVPHSLQHGVRVVEFQTPTYERYIISFAQQVLTQDHWDYEHAIEHMSIDAPPVETFEDVAPGIERIATFDDFNVWRVDCATAVALTLPTQIPYAVCMAIGGTVNIAHLRLAPEEACLVPALALPTTQIAGDPHSQVLIAAPTL